MINDPFRGREMHSIEGAKYRYFFASSEARLQHRERENRHQCHVVILFSLLCLWHDKPQHLLPTHPRRCSYKLSEQNA